MGRSSRKNAIISAACLLGFGFAASACAMIWGFEDPLDPESSPALLGDGSVAEGRAPGCEDEKVDETRGVFVVGGSSGDGSVAEDPLCGSKDSPCARIATGLSRARDLGKTIVYVVRGTYVEGVTIPGGITLMGGWNALKTGSTIAYARACADAPGSTVSIIAPDDKPTAVLIEEPGVSLVDLTIRSKSKAAASESLYAVRVRGMTAKLDVKLTDVFAYASTAGDGVSGGAGASGDAGTGACDPPTATAAASPPPADAGHGGDAGASPGFGIDGIAGANGADGVPGARGYNGVTPEAPVPITCYGTCTSGVITTPCNGSNVTMPSGIAGKAGCGGYGGGGGKGGSGGGSSVALYAWNAAITIARGGFSAQNGGAGGTGGIGAGGGEGALGVGGSDSSPACTTSCGTSIAGNLCTGATTGTSKGTAGTKGGAGGVGGSGGAGSGGDSFAIASGGGSTITLADPSSTVLAYGKGGVAPAGGVPGRAAAQGAP